MQFGLDARNSENVDAKLLMFPSDSKSNPRKRIEAKSYRARDRFDSGWFSHDSGTPSNSLPGGTPGKSIHKCCCRCGNQVTPVPALTPRSTSRSEGRQNRDHILGYDHPPEWFGLDQHTPKKLESAISLDRTPKKNVSSLRKREFFPSSKDWYRHEHTVVCGDEEEISSHSKAACFSSPSWWPVEKDDSHGSVEQSPRPRLLGPDAERYWQRDHVGSTKEWFSHEHTQETRKEHVIGGPASESEVESSQGETNICCCSCRQNTALTAGDGLSKSDDASVGRRTRQALTEKFLQAL